MSTSSDMMFSDVFHQVVKGYIVGNQVLAALGGNLQLLGNAGADECQLVRDAICNIIP